MSVRDLGPHNLLWQIKKQESTYTVKSNVTLRVEDPLTRFTQVPDVSVLIEGYKPHAAAAAAKTKPSNLVIHRSQKATVNGIAFSGYQAEEARPDGFVVVHVAAFTVRGRDYNCDAVLHFANKHPDPAKVKIAYAEWKSILSSVR